MLVILVSTLSVMWHLICGNNWNWLLILKVICKTLWTGAGSNLSISMLQTQLVSLDQSNNTGAILSFARTASNKIRALIYSVKFLSHEVALYLYKSTIQLCMEYCRTHTHVWTVAPSCYLKLFDKPQKQIRRTTIPSLPAFLKPLARVASLSFFCRYFFGRCSSELVQLVPLLLPSEV